MIQKIINYNQVLNLFSKILLPTCLVALTPISAYSSPTELKAWISTIPQKTSSFELYKDSIKNNASGIQLAKDLKNISTMTYLNYGKDKKLNFDNSFIELKGENKTIGFGKISRNWSFSPHTSLILSNNARPMNSIYFSLNNKEGSNNLALSWAGPWSFETFNSFQTSSKSIKNSMLLGMRVTIEPVHNLKFEILKTSQWGGDGYSKNLSAFTTALLGNSNDSKYSNINQLAGYGLSYLTKMKNIQSRFYGQFIGEDEAGGLPSCFMSLVGSELVFPKNRILSKIGVEYIDTRIDETTHGWCGPNTAYNNNTYKYTNYNKTLGAPIDTEGKSLNLWASADLTTKTNIYYSITNVVINDANWANHRLSTNKQSGWVTSIATSWKFNSVFINSKLTYQNLFLDKANIKEELFLGIKAEYNF